MESWKGNRTPSNPQEGYYVGLTSAAARSACSKTAGGSHCATGRNGWPRCWPCCVPTACNRAFCVLHNSARLNVVQFAQLNAERQCAILFIIKTTRGYYMPISEAKKRNNANYTAKCDYINIRPLKPEGAKIRAAAENAGQSLQGYILQAIRERMERDGLPIDQPAADEEEK